MENIPIGNFREERVLNQSLNRIVFIMRAETDRMLPLIKCFLSGEFAG
jgi:hypothetical protein